MIEIRKTDIYAKWLDNLSDIYARARILARVERLATGKPGDFRPVGEGVSELRIDYGPGYRVYYKKHGGSWQFSWLAVTKILRPKTLEPPCASPVPFRRLP